MSETAATASRAATGGHSLAVPAEGDGGLFSEAWFPIVPSHELVAGQILSKPFLDGKVIAVRGGDGRAQVLSPYCPHLGAGLESGDMLGEHIRCPFHHWEFDLAGRCVRTGIGDAVPPRAQLFAFPTVERFGMVYAFNGETPHYPLPDLPVPDDRLSVRVRYDVPLIPVDPWVICANTPDWQHLATVHAMDFRLDDILSSIVWTDHSMEYDLVARLPPEFPFKDLRMRAGIFGGTLFRAHGTIDGRWFGMMTPFGLPQPGMTQNYFVTLLDTGAADAPEPEEFEAFHLQLFQFGKAFTDNDRPIFYTGRYRPGLLTKSDQLLVRFLKMMQVRPRSHHSAAFIN